MLPEILLSLAGHSSEIWDKVRVNDTQADGLHNYVSEPEKAMLKVLEHISVLHLQIKANATRLCNDHDSMICRGVCAGIINKHLAAFRKKVLEVEAAILSEDAGYVGGYGIVPLSTIVSEFQPWTRRLEYLHKVIKFAESWSEHVSLDGGNGGTAMLNRLRKDTKTGFTDIADIAEELLVTAQLGWMGMTASWILYGVFPLVGENDFFIAPTGENTDTSFASYKIVEERVPDFLTLVVAEQILAIGNALMQLQSRGARETAQSLLPRHLEAFCDLQYPLNAAVFAAFIAKIDESISQNALAQLLPPEDIERLLSIICRFVLLANGEWAVALIEHAKASARDRQTTNLMRSATKTRKFLDLEIKQHELDGILSKTWDELAAVTGASEDDTTGFAQRNLSLGLEKGALANIPSSLLPSPTSLILNVPPDSNLGLFLTVEDTRMYAQISSYLLSIRRMEVQIASLWKLSGQRRIHPTPIGPPTSATSFGQKALKIRRNRDAARHLNLRRSWATANKTHFVASELDAYLHGEVIRNSWNCFDAWLSEQHGQSTSSRSHGSCPGTSSSKLGSGVNDGTRDRQADPRVLSSSHRLFLNALHKSLWLGQVPLLKTLSDLLETVDHFVALLERLQSIWQGLDLQEDDGVVDPFSDFNKEEKEVQADMARTRSRLEELLTTLVEDLKTVSKERQTDPTSNSFGRLELEKRSFVPWTPRTMDRLLMKLDFLHGMAGRGDEEDGLVSD